MIDPKTGRVFWTKECEDPIKAIDFALDDIIGDHDAMDFLAGWREGDVSEYPEFIKFVTKQEK